MSGTTKLWATASKEWIIPSKPKPGRKPKKDVAPAGDDEDDAKGRRIQNRAAQRAFRERKQSQLAELQARILSYEQGEIERNVALQKIAKRLKEDNDKLIQENNALKERVAKLEEQRAADSNDKKRWRDESPWQNRPVRKRSRTSATPPVVAELSDQPSPATTLVATPEAPSPLPQPTYTNLPPELEQSGVDEMLDFSSSMKDDSIGSNFPQFDCGFCSDDTPCVCRELALNQLNDSATQDLLAGFKVASFTAVESSTMVVEVPSKPTPSSILENLPAYQPPVPLRRKGVKVPPSKSIFPVYAAPEMRTNAATLEATCSGDPSNCAACNDDAFGKAFCSAIEETVNTRAICGNCPSRHADGALDPRTGLSTGNGCCGSLVGCGGCPSSSPSSPSGSARTIIQYEQDPLQDYSPQQEYIPTNDAWQRIKAHPNVQFADLSLLAEVVSSRSKCTGPRIVITPPPDRRGNNQNTCGSSASNTHLEVKQEGPRLVPQEILLECGRRRVREVHSDAVRDALRLLDAKFT